MSILSENLKILHRESGYTFEDLSEKTGIDVNILKAFENDQLTPDTYQLEVLCRVLKMPFEDITVRNIQEERKNATKSMKNNNTRETYNWYFGNRRVFLLYLGYVIYFVVMVTVLSLYYVNKLQDLNIKELFADYQSYSHQYGIIQFTFFTLYQEVSVGLTIFSFGALVFMAIDYLRRNQFVFRWWMLLFLGSILSILKIFGLVASIPYLIIVVSKLIRGKY